MFDLDEDPRKFPTEHLEREICQLAAHIYAATCRWLELVAEFDRRGCHVSLGFESTTAWLAWSCGLTRRCAREHVRVARALTELPRIRAAFATGELSYSKVRALTRVADTDSEDDLLSLGRSATAAQLERTVRALRSAVAVADGTVAEPFLSWTWENDGTLSVRGRLPAEEGALFLEMMHKGRNLAHGPGGPALPAADGDPMPPPVTNVEALAAAAEASLCSSEGSTGGDRYQVVLHVEQGGRCELEEGSTVAPATAARLLCDSALVRIGEVDGEAVSVGRRTRAISGSLRRALRARDRSCRFPGCTHRRFVDAHHIVPWAEGGETSVENTVQVCRRHHRLLHEGGFTVERAGPGDFVFRRPDGVVLRARDRLPSGGPRAIRGRPSALPARGTGDPFDLGWTVGCMIDNRRARQERRRARAPDERRG